MMGPTLVFWSDRVEGDVDFAIQELLMENRKKGRLKKTSTAKFLRSQITIQARKSNGDVGDSPELEQLASPSRRELARSPDGKGHLRNEASSRQTSAVSNLFCEFETDDLYAEYVQHKISEHARSRERKSSNSKQPLGSKAVSNKLSLKGKATAGKAP